MTSNRAKKISIYLPLEHVGALASRAEAEGVSLSAAASQMIERGLFQSERIDHTETVNRILSRVDAIQSDFRANDERQISRLEKLIVLINKALGSKK
jgi:hypothetical protein